MDTTNVIEKKPYTPPQLIEYGNLEEITGTNLDIGDDVAPFGSRPIG